MAFTASEYRHLASCDVKRARSYPIGDCMRVVYMDQARAHLTQAHNIEFQARFAGGAK